MFAASSGIGRPSLSLSRQYSPMYSGISKCDPKHVGQLIESVLEDKPKALQRVLKKKNLDVNILVRFEENVEKMSPLHYSALRGKCEIAHILIQSKMCTLDLQTPFDEATALHFACQRFDSDVAYTVAYDLLLHGADVNIIDHWGKTCLIWASERGHLDVVKLLLSKRAGYNHCCAIEDPPDCMGGSTRFSSPIWEHLYKDPYYGNSALIQACRFNHIDIVKELISNGCNIDAQNMNKSTAMHAAAGAYYDKPNSIPLTGDSSIINYLIQCGANMNMQDQHGFTPLARSVLAMCEIFHLNIAFPEKIPPLLHCIEKAQLLIKAGCDVTKKYAFFSGESSVLSQLLAFGKNILVCNNALLEEEFCRTVEMLTSTGCPVYADDVQLATNLNLPSLTSTVLFHFENPLSLKCICLIFVRKHTRSPLKEYVTDLELPELLRRQLCLE